MPAALEENHLSVWNNHYQIYHTYVVEDIIMSSPGGDIKFPTTSLTEELKAYKDYLSGIITQTLAAHM